ncbi:hypothetical protein LUZ60_015320 [Juncus effusus]|nr:hypothetical protein LUZ60_015320 [Juncus effusus]
MGPLRGMKRKRREKSRPDPLCLQPESADWWVVFSRRISATLSIPIEELNFQSIFKIQRTTFNYICSLIHSEITSKKNVHYAFNDGTAMATEDLVAVALRRFSSGDSLVNVGTAFGANHSTVSQVTWRFVEAMEAHALRHISWPQKDEMEEIKNKFQKIRGLPNCCGAVDATHVMLCLPSGEPNAKVWMDGEKNHSMVIQVIVDADMRFRDMITGWPGSMTEFQILKSSNFYKLCEKGARLQNSTNLLEGNPTDLLEGSGMVREYIVGDSAYPLLPWLITPYQGNNNNNNNSSNSNISSEKLEFNKRHLMTRSVASRALSRFKEMWRFFQGEMWRPDKHKLPRMILVCGLIHNIIIDLEGESAKSDEVAIGGNVHDGNYKSRVCEFEDRNGVLMRDVLSRYLSEKLG